MVSFDPAKARSNFRKHGVRFVDCVPALEDANAITVEDPHGDEQRFNTLGTDANGTLVLVTWTERGDSIRLISARKASAGEAQHHGEGR